MSQISKQFYISFIVSLVVGIQLFAQPVNRHALLVGIGAYPKSLGWPLLHADADAEKMKAVLLSNQFAEQNIILLLNADAQHANIQLALKKIYDKAEPEDQVVIYLGGHSQQITDVSGDEADGLDEAFVCADAGSKFKPEEYEGRNHLLDDDLARWIDRISEKITRNGSLLFIYDGAMSKSNKQGSFTKGPFPHFELKPPGQQKQASPEREYDNDWADISFSENNTQVTTISPEALVGCQYFEMPLPDKGYLSPLTVGLSKTLSKPGIRYRDLEKLLKSEQTKMNLPCGWKIDGAITAEIFKKGKVISPKAVEATSFEETNGNVYSIIVGVSKYQNVQPLEYGHADALMFRSMLQTALDARFVEENHYIFLDSNATIKPIIMAFEDLNRKVKEGDKVYFYFAGHGDVENLISRKGHLLLYNSPSNVYKAGGTLPIEDVKDYFAQWLYKRTRVFLVVDACKSGKLAGGLEGKEALLNGIGEGINQSARLLSCQPNEFSQESVSFGGGHGAFTYFLVKGINGIADQNGDSKITIGEIAGYIKDSVSNATLQYQNPLVVGNSSLPFMPKIAAISSSGKAKPNLHFAPDVSGSSTDDSLKKQWKRSFYEHVEAMKFLSPPNSCARTSYDQLLNTFPLDNKLKAELTLAFQNGIDKKAQYLINEYIKGNDQFVQEEVFASTAKELNFMMDHLMKSTDKLYFPTMARKFFFEGRSIKPRQVDNDLHRFTLDKAISNLRSSLRIEPEGAQNYNAIGRLKQANRQYEEAIQNYKKAIEFAPRWKFPINNLATAFHDLSRVKRDRKLLDSSIFYYQKCLEIDPKFAGAHKNLGKAYWNLGQARLAKQQYLKGIFFNPAYVETYQNLGDVYRMEQQYDSANYYLRLGLTIKPNHADILTNLGNVAFELTYQKPEEKIKLLSEAKSFYTLAINSDSLCIEAMLGLGNVFWETGKYDSSAFYYEKTVNLDSLNLTYKNYLFEAYLRKGNLSKAETLGQKMIKKHPNDITTWFDFGVLAVLQKNESQAIARFKKAIALGLTEKAKFEDDPLLEGFRKGREYASLVLGLK